MNFKTLVGLEIHVELSTETKIFCDCPNEFGGEVNSHCCPICLGLPGALPSLNKQVLEYAMKAGLAFNCDITKYSKMDRKNYFYSDLVKGYQISQDNMPICTDGYIEIELEEGKSKKIRIERIHIEEDTGKSIHTDSHDTLLDYNRAGVPLIEIVTKPDINTPEEARLFLEKLRETLQFLKISDVKMEEGSLRCDINVNVITDDTKSNITEIKNLNSFRAAEKSIEYEEKRHRELLSKGLNTEKDTRRWDEIKGKTIPMREKGELSDYRYALDSNIPPIEISEDWLNKIKKSLPELPHEKRDRFIEEYKLNEYDAEVLTGSVELADFYEEVLKYIDDTELVSNWIMTDVLRRVNDENLSIDKLKFTAKDLADLLRMIKDGKISNNIGKKVFRQMFEKGDNPKKVVEQEGLLQISDESELENIVSKILDENEQSIIDYKEGKDRALGYLMGQVMKETRGKANPQKANKLIRDMIEDR